MDTIWAPWRMAYIRGHTDGAECFLCAARQGSRDAANLVVRRGRRCFAILNRYPYTNGHLMVAPNGHRGALGELAPGEMLEMMQLARDAQKALQEAFRPDGYNLGVNLGRVAGAGLLGHLHLHVVPRWNGDTNFMAVTGGAKVMPMALDEVYRALRRRMGGRGRRSR